MNLEFQFFNQSDENYLMSGCNTIGNLENLSQYDDNNKFELIGNLSKSFKKE